jgi:DNA-binding response OmpR family regulator
MRVLVVEDDPQLQTILMTGLGELGYEVAAASTYAEGRERATLGTWALIILDVMLPDGDGLALCASLRNAGVVTPVLILTARGSVDDKVSGLDAGADDYLAKPFVFRELLARVRALTRRQPGLTPELVRIADLEVNLRPRVVQRGGQDIVLTAKEFALLECFVRQPNVVLGRADITAHVWDENHDPFANALEVLVRRLRRKIDDPFSPKLIHTLRGAGYRFGV